MIYTWFLVAAVLQAPPTAGLDRKWHAEVDVFAVEGDQSAVRGQQAEVIVRGADGAIQYRGQTDPSGSARIPLDSRTLTAAYQIEARISLGGDAYVGSFVSGNPKTGRYKIILPPQVIID